MFGVAEWGMNAPLTPNFVLNLNFQSPQNRGLGAYSDLKNISHGRKKRQRNPRGSTGLDPASIGKY